jgi:hypothetical protein
MIATWAMSQNPKNLSNFCNYKIENENPAHSDLIQGAGHKYDAYHH